MRSFNLRLKQSVKHIATAVVVLAALIHATADSAQAGARVGRQPNNTGFLFDFNENADLQNGSFQEGLSNIFFLSDQGVRIPNDCPSIVNSVNSCIPFKSGDLYIDPSEKSFHFFGSDLSDSSNVQPGVKYTTTLFPKNSDAVLTLRDRSDDSSNRPIASSPVKSLTVALTIIKPDRDYTTKLPSYTDLQNLFNTGGELQVNYGINVEDQSLPELQPLLLLTTYAFNSKELSSPDTKTFVEVANSDISAKPVPEPIEGTVLGAGVMGAGLLLLKRRKAKQQSSKL